MRGIRPAKSPRTTMPVVFHSLIALSYAAFSAAIAFGLPKTSAAVDPTVAILCGGVALLAAGFVHQSLARLFRGRNLELKPEAGSPNGATLEEQLEEARRDIQDLKRLVRSGLGQAGPEGDDDVGVSNREAMSELRLLRTLFSQLATARTKNIESTGQAPDKMREIEGTASELQKTTGSTDAGVSGDGKIRSERADAASHGELATHGAEDNPATTPSGFHGDSVAASSHYEPVRARSEYRSDWASGGGGSAAAAGAMRLQGDPLAEATLDQSPAQHGTSTIVATASSNAGDILQVTRDALEKARVSLFLQPVVKLPNRKTTHFEAFSRIRDADGVLIGPQQYIELAERAGLIGAIDNHLFFRCVQLLRRVRRHNRDYGFFCNMSPHTLTDEAFFPQFLDFLAENDELSRDLIFEFSQADVMLPHDDFSENLDRLAKLGFRFSVDRVANLHQDYQSLAGRHFRYIKIGATDLFEMTQDEQGHAQLEALMGELHEARITLIVEKIENERQLVELLDHNIPYGQGYLFGEPRESKTLR